MVLAIFSHTPLWVFAVLAVLIYRGFAAMQDRPVQFAPLLLIAAGFAVMGGQGAMARADGDAVLLMLWVAGLAAGLAAGFYSVTPGQVFGSRRQPMQRASVIPLILILAIFSARYGVGVASAMHPELFVTPASVAAVCALYGALSGLMIGRAAKVVALALRRPSDGAIEATPA